MVLAHATGTNHVPGTERPCIRFATEGNSTVDTLRVPFQCRSFISISQAMKCGTHHQNVPTQQDLTTKVSQVLKTRLLSLFPWGIEAASFTASYMLVRTSCLKGEKKPKTAGFVPQRIFRHRFTARATSFP